MPGMAYGFHLLLHIVYNKEYTILLYVYIQHKKPVIFMPLAISFTMYKKFQVRGWGK